MRDRLLTQHFLQRFLENDLLSPDADRGPALAMVGGGLLTLGLFVSIGISMKFVFMPFQSPGRTALLALGDRLIFVTISMIVMSLVAVMIWDALSLDPRDTAIFGPLPIERGVIVRAKLRAVGILAGAFALTISSFSSVFHPSLMVAKLNIGLLPALALMIIHLLITFGAGIFAFSVIVVLRELLRAALGIRFARVSAGLQAALIVALITTFLLLPAFLMRAGRANSSTARMLPPVWFVGLHEALAGEMVAGLSRRPLPDAFARQEERAAAQYRDLAAKVTPLAWRALMALTFSVTIAIGAYFWNSRQLPLPLVGNRAGGYRRPGLPARIATFAIARRPATQAGFFFTLQCLFRSGPHRVVMACCTAVSIALATVFLAAGSRATITGLWTVPLYVFSAQTLALAVMISGFRHVSRLPADIPANRLFRLAWIADSSRFVAGVRRGATTGVVVPVIVALLPAYFYLLGPRLALMHALSGFLLGTALVSILLFRTSHLPFVASYAAAEDLNTRGPVILIGGLISISIASRIEQFALADLESAAVFWFSLVMLAVLPRLAAGRNAQLDLPSAFDVPAPGTTRLDLG